jgi:uroporphyrinogen decarboxylase
MPDFDNFRNAVLCHREPRRVPQFDGTVAETIKARLLGRPILGIEDEVDFWMAAGYDYVPLTIGLRQTIRGEQRGIMGDARLHTKLLKPVEAPYNPFEKGPNTRMWAEEGSGVIADQASFDDFDWPDPDRSYPYQTLEKLGKLLPDGAKAVLNVGYLFMAPWMLMGLETFLTALADRNPLVGKVIDRVGSIQKRVVENVLQFDCVGAVRMPDDLAHTGGTIVNPGFLRRQIFPRHREIGRLVRAKGLLYLFHSDGRLYEVIDDLIQCGYHALHPCEPASMDILELKRRYAGRLCLMGNINLDSTLCLGTPNDVVEEVRLRLRTVAPGGGYCCGSSNSIPEYVPFANYVAMIETIKRCGKYPIGEGWRMKDEARSKIED